MRAAICCYVSVVAAHVFLQELYMSHAQRSWASRQVYCGSTVVHSSHVHQW